MAGGCTGFDVTISGAALQIGRNCGSPPGAFYNAYTFPEANRWYHVVAVYDGTNINAYVDGVSYTGGAVTYDNSSTYCIGSYNCGDELFNGKIDEVYLWNRALSAAEIIALYTSSNNQKINSSKNSRLPSGLVGLWSFNGGDISNGVALDRSGSGNNGNLFNIATSTFYDAGKVGQGFNFDGSNDYVSVGSLSSYSFVQNTGVFSATAWIKLATTAGQQAIFGSSETRSAKGFVLFYTGNQLLHQAYNGDGVTYVFVGTSAASSLSDTNWHHVAWTGDGSNVRVYIDGVVSGSLAGVGNLSSGDSTRTVLVGASNAASPSNLFSGIIDEVRIYNRALTAAEIKQLYDMGR